MVARGLRNPPASMTIAILTGRSAAESIPHRPIRMQPKPSELRKCAKQSQRETVFNFLSFKELHPPSSIISTKNKPNPALFGLINREGSHATNGQADEFGPPEIGRRKSSRFWTSGRGDRFWPRTKYLDRYGRVGDKSMTNSTAPDRSTSRMQTMPGKSLATSLKRERRALNDMHFRMPFARASGLYARLLPTRTGSRELRSSAEVLR
jgi:hypothetical protein